MCGSSSLDAFRRRTIDAKKRTDAISDRGADRTGFSGFENDKYHTIDFSDVVVTRKAFLYSISNRSNEPSRELTTVVIVSTPATNGLED